MSGKRSRDKGARFEREVVNQLREWGFHALRVPLSGAADGFKGDVILDLDVCIDKEVLFKHLDDIGNGTRKLECKTGKQVPNFIYDKLADNYALVVKRDRQPILVVLRLEDWTP